MKRKRVHSALRRENGFTLVEVVVASVISAFIALVAVGTLKMVSASAERVEKNIGISSESRFASRCIATDLSNIYRDIDVKKMKFAGWYEDDAASGESFLRLVFYTAGRTKARADQSEGDVYEVEYFLSSGENGKSLMRRLWPNPDDSIEAKPGGVVTRIAENVEFFEARFFDGSQWQYEWPLESETMPELVEVTIAAGTGGNKGDNVVQSFMVNLFGTKAGSASAVESTENSSETGGQSGQEGTSNVQR